MKWKVYWSRGPHDNPQDGVVEVEADSATEGALIVGDQLETINEIDAIIRTDLENDFVPFKHNEIEERVIASIRRRRDHGRNKYGTSMERGDLQLTDWLQHAQEEALDLAIYLEKLKRDHFAPPSVEFAKSVYSPPWALIAGIALLTLAIGIVIYSVFFS